LPVRETSDANQLSYAHLLMRDRTKSTGGRGYTFIHSRSARLHHGKRPQK
jgi:hypothetical protein